MAHTCARRTGPRLWRRALERAVKRGLIPGFTDSTWAIIDVLISRMGFDTGHARYVLADVLERTGLKRSAVTKHVALLRSAGWLAWVEHGTQRRGLRDGGAYTRTATVYAATIPPAYDEAEGNILRGRGYWARVLRPKTRPVQPVDTAGTAPVENSGDKTAWTPSRWMVKEVGQVQVVGGEEASTGQARTALKSPRRKKKFTVTGYKITPERIERSRQVARWVRPLVNWLQRASHDQLSWVLLDLVARDWTDNQILVWLGQVGRQVGAQQWRPKFPHRVLAAALRRKDEADTQQAHGYAGPDPDAARTATGPTAAFGEAVRIAQANGEAMQARITPREPGGGQSWLIGEHHEVTFTQAEKAAQLKAVAEDPALVLSSARIVGREQTIALYGTQAARILDAHAEFQAAGTGRLAGLIA